VSQITSNIDMRDYHHICFCNGAKLRIKIAMIKSFADVTKLTSGLLALAGRDR
jgi:hypothetical protein